MGQILKSFAVQKSEPLHSQIGKHLREQINSGELPAGQRLPSTPEIALQLGVDKKAVQRAMAHLAAEGLVDRVRRRGTYVRPIAEKAVIGVLLGISLEDETAHFYRALMRAVRAEARQHEWTCRVYDGVNPVTDSGNPLHEEALHHLKSDIRNYAFKGQLHIAVRWRVTQQIEQDSGLPVARWNPEHMEDDPRYDVYQFVRDSVACLAQRGRKRIVFLSTPWGRLTSCPELDGFWDEARAQGLTEIEVLSIPQTGSTRHHEADVQQRLTVMIREWRSRPGGMPDGLIVDDDIMMRGAALALLGAGVQVPKEMMVVTQANDQVHLHYGVPVVRYEYPVKELAHELVRFLWKRMVGEAEKPIVLRGRIQDEEV